MTLDLVLANPSRAVPRGSRGRPPHTVSGGHPPVAPRGSRGRPPHTVSGGHPPVAPRGSPGGAAPRRVAKRGAPRKRVLVVNAYFDDLRRDGGRPYSVPQAIGPPYLAGAFSPVLCDVRLYNEQYSGPLEDKDLLGWPDMLVLTGLTVAFDRMRQLTGYARTLNPKVIVVAGGPAVRALPRHSGRIFDYACTGDIEQMQDVIADALGPAYVNRDMFPRFDLTYWFGRIAYVESSRNCNFRCSFCSLTGEGNRYQKYDLDYIRRQVMAVGKRRQVYFLDNNFYGNDRGFFLDRLELLKEMKREGRFGGWGALVTQDFFLNDENLRLARESGCIGLFSGIESFDVEVLRRFNKRQNARVPQVELIRKCLDAGILFLYGVIFDLSSRRLSECREEIAFITGTPEIPLPGFVTQAIPLLGTPYFHECLENDLLLPNTKLRDMDGTTLVQRPLDPIDEVRSFLSGLPVLRGYRRRVLRHTAGFVRRYGRRLSADQIKAVLGTAAMVTAPSLASAPTRMGLNRRDWQDRTFVTTTEHLDGCYRPAFRVESRYEDHFKPTMVTDADGCLAGDLAEDLLGAPTLARTGTNGA